MNLFHNFWFIQFLGAVALMFVLFAWNAKTRKSIILLQSVNLVLFIVHYLLLSASVGAIMCGVVLVRNFIFFYKGEKAWANNSIWLYSFIVISVVTLAIFWNGWITLLPVAGVVLGCYAMWKDRPADMRLLMLITCLLWLPYTIVIKSYPGILSQFVGILAILMGIYRHDRKNLIA